MSQNLTTNVERVKQRNVGRSGLRVSEIGLRTDSVQALARFAEAGGTLIDVRPSSSPAIHDIGAHHFVIATTVGVDVTQPLGKRVDCSRRALLDQVDHFLAQTKLDHIDLLSVGHFDPHTPVDEVCETLSDLRRSGKIRYAGACGYRGWQLAVTPGLTAVQTPYSLLRRGAEEELIPAANFVGAGVIATGPVVEHPFEALSTAADGLGVTPESLAAAWTLARVDSIVVTDAELEAVLPVAELPKTIDRALEEVSRVG